MTVKHQHGPRLTFSTGEAAKICAVSQQTIIRCFDAGTLRGFRVPGSKFRHIPREALVRFMVEHDIPGARLTMYDKPPLEERAAAVEGPFRVNRITELVGRDEAA